MVGMLLLDLQKAFDKVDYSILLMKLEASDLGKAIFLFKSYLSDRKQLVDLSGTHSSGSPITCGIRSPKAQFEDLFYFYFMSMTCELNVVKNKLLLYADDSGILVSDKNKQGMENF